MIWTAICLCLLLSFVFSGIEAGILSVNRVRLAHYAKLKAPGAVRLSRLLNNPQRLLVNVLIVTNLMNIAAIVLTTREIVRWFEASESHAHLWTAYLLSFAICLPLYLFGFGVLPKSLFRRFPYRALAAFSNLLRVTDFLLSPVLAIVDRLARWVPAEGNAAARKLYVAREEFKYFTIEGERTGTLTKLERDMIHNVVDFRAVTARDVMIPMENVWTVGEDESTGHLFDLSRRYDIDRFPVLSASGEIVGLVNVFDVLLGHSESNAVRVFQRRIVRSRPEEQAYTIIRKLRSAHITLAAVFDDAGKPVGIVSSEDLIRRLIRAAIPTPQFGQGRYNNRPTDPRTVRVGLRPAPTDSSATGDAP